MTEITNPHDRFFRETLARPGAARAFLQQYLPPEMAAVLDVSAPEIVQDSFVDAELQAHQADLLYRIRLQAGRRAYVYVLFEHKSTPDRWVAFQLLRYLVRIWERTLRERGELWPIVPLVVYHGQDAWWVGRTFQELLDVPEPLTACTPDYRYVLCDLTAYSDEALRGEVLLHVMTLTLKYIFRPELSDRLPELVGLLRQLADQETGLEYVETVLRYLVQAARYVQDEELREAVATAFHQEGEALMSTIAQKWLEQGKREGVRKGLLIGIEVSLEIKFGAESLHLLPEIYHIADPGILRVVLKAINTAKTPEDLRRFYRSVEASSADQEA